MLDQATCEEPSQSPLDDGAERAVLLGEALRVHPQELLQVLLDETEERKLPGPTRPNTRAQISTPPQLPAGETGANRERVPGVQRR